MAELIFFPGVRYQRAEVSPQPQPEVRRSRRAKVHDRIELAE